MALQGIARSFLTALRIKDESTYRHSKKVMYYSLRIAQYLGLENRQMELLKWASLLHDVGKLVLSDTILKGNGKPKSEGSNVSSTPYALAAEIFSSTEEMKEILPIIKGHHGCCGRRT